MKLIKNNSKTQNKRNISIKPQSFKRPESRIFQFTYGRNAAESTGRRLAARNATIEVFAEQ